MFRGVLAMAYSPRNYDDFYETGGEDGPLVDERVPKSDARLSHDLIHFDLDPSNSQSPRHGLAVRLPSWLMF